MKRARPVLIAVFVVAMVAAGCGTSGGDDKSATKDKADTTKLTVPDDAGQAEEPDFGDVAEETEAPQEGDDLDSVLVAAVASQQEFWADQFPGLFGADFTPLPDSRVLPLSPGDDSGDELCQQQVVTYDIVEGNAIAFDCGVEGEMIGWDTESIVKDAAETNGPLGAAAILAHEFGHVVQYQSDTEIETPYSELQADCYAGAWVAGVTADPPSELEGYADANAVDASLSAILDLRDPVGSGADEEGAHGNGFDRVRSFQEGVEDGAEKCAGYVDQPPTVTEVQFTTQEDLDAGGNLPLDEVVPLATEDLDNYYGALIDGWEPLGTIQSSDIETEDPDTFKLLSDLSEQKGDGAVLVFLGIGWADSVQEILEQKEGRDEAGVLLQAACLAGDWMGHAFFDQEGDPTFGSISLSPGDLDEAIMGLISVATSQGQKTEGGLFELISAYRQGVVERSDACL